MQTGDASGVWQSLAHTDGQKITVVLCVQGLLCVIESSSYLEVRQLTMFELTFESHTFNITGPAFYHLQNMSKV